MTDILETLVYIRQLFPDISKKYGGIVYSQNYLNWSVLIAYLTYVLPTFAQNIAKSSYFYDRFLPETGVRYH